MLQGFGIAQGALIQQLLKDTTVVETELYFRDQFVRDVNRKAASFDAPVKDMTGMLFTRATGFAMLAHTGASPQAQRTKRGGPEKGGPFSEPLLDIGESLSSTWHGACVPYNTHACQLKNENPQSHSQLRVSRQKLARQPRDRYRSNHFTTRSASMMPPIRNTITANGSASMAHTPDKRALSPLATLDHLIE